MRSRLPRVDVLEMLAASASAAFAMDRFDRIIYWNRGAADILGWSPAQAAGRLCFDLLAGRDLFGNVYCSKSCPIVTGVTEGAAIEPFWLDVAAPEGTRRHVRVWTLPLPAAGPAFSCLMHLIERGDSTEMESLVKALRAAARVSPPVAQPCDPLVSLCPLSSREREILHLLSQGYACLNIAARLNRSLATVRNHVKNILGKLKVHSQVEAVALAFRRGYLEIPPAPTRSGGREPAPR